MRLDAPEVQAENDEGERTPAFVFDFREASEHYVKASPRNSFQSGHAPGPQAGGSTVVQHPSGFNMPRNYTARMWMERAEIMRPLYSSEALMSEISYVDYALPTMVD